MNRDQQIMKELSEFTEYDRGSELRLELKLIYLIGYKPSRDDKFYLDFIKDNVNSFSIKECHAQSMNEPYVYNIFTIKTQHIYGNSLEHCIDLWSRKK